ncbi:hypothetical protein BUE93_18660 [Chromobacterium amazonense]|uniref:DNA-binding protein n=1 Tax=Chromobacterium amazonense TaxID=1382803 RepID=A0A2S9X025_9NEIS|nr:DNA-binding protein [Chromobacterium amazonense]PRP69077.1 hypothetical protein BUE93_18660 [Chromobacterium amazonense]
MQTIEKLAQSTMDTNDFARVLGQKAQSIRKAYAQRGAVMGIRPVKLPNGKLRWPTDAVERLMKGNAA